MGESVFEALPCFCERELADVGVGASLLQVEQPRAAADGDRFGLLGGGDAEQAAQELCASVAGDAVDHDQFDVALGGCEQLFVGVAACAGEDEQVGALGVCERADLVLPLEDRGCLAGDGGEQFAGREDAAAPVADQARDLQLAEQVLAAGR